MRHWKEDEEGYGVYERVDQNTPMRDALLAGIYEPMGESPELSSLLAPLLDTEERSGLVAVKDSMRQSAVSALETMRFVQTSQAGADPIEGDAAYILGEFAGSGWVTSMVEQGYMVMVKLATVGTGSIGLAATKQPSVIVARCRTGMGWAMVAGPSQLAIDAMNLALTGFATCAPPSVWDAAQGKCVPSPSGLPVPGGAEQPAAQSTGLPSWVVPVAVGGGALVIAALLLMGQKRPPERGAMRANPKHLQTAAQMAAVARGYENRADDAGRWPRTRQGAEARMRAYWFAGNWYAQAGNQAEQDGDLSASRRFWAKSERMNARHGRMMDVLYGTAPENPRKKSRLDAARAKLIAARKVRRT